MKILVYSCLLISLLTGCKKFLDEKPDKKLLLPTTVSAVQGMLDYDNVMNLACPATGEVSSDNYFLPDANFNALTSAAQKNMYTWEADVTLNEYPNHWSRLYDVVTIANVALESLEKISPAPAEMDAWKNAKGSALVFRAKSLLTAVGYWAKAYNETTAGRDPGIPLRLSPDYNVVSVRAPVKTCYEQVVADLSAAAALLPVVPKHVIRPSLPAAYGLLARTYLFMNRFDSALVYANKYLAIKNALLNFNSLSTTASFPFALYNAEVAMHTIMSTPVILANTRACIDSQLYKEYAANDLRQVLFFRGNGNGTYQFKGSYNQSAALYTGVTTDEIYLTKAECEVRLGKRTEGLASLNALMITRWKTGSFVPFAATTDAEGLGIILAERRKELIFRDIRWMDLKRLNSEGKDIEVKRKLAGVEYVLKPNDNRYALPIPESVIALSGMSQNPR